VGEARAGTHSLSHVYNRSQVELTGSFLVSPTGTGHYVDEIRLRSLGDHRHTAGEYHHNTATASSCDW
jgi:hypothetical protein